MALQNTRNEKELKKAEDSGNLNASANLSDKSPGGKTTDQWDNENRVENQFVRSVDDRKTTGRETMHVHAPEVALSPTSSDSAEKNNKNWRTQGGKLLKVDNAFVNKERSVNLDEHPFLSLEFEQGLFLPNRQGLTTDDMLLQINKEIYQLRGYAAEVEKDINGDDILESIIVAEKKRNDDGTIALTNGKPIVGALQQNRPKLIHTRNFVAHAVAKGDEIGENTKAPEDGVLIIRVV